MDVKKEKKEKKKEKNGSSYLSEEGALWCSEGRGGPPCVDVGPGAGGVLEAGAGGHVVLGNLGIL